MPEFIKIIIAVMAGLVADPIRSAILTALQAKRMRRSLYFELAAFHKALDSTVGSPEANAHWDAEFIRKLRPEVYKQARTNPDVFYSLPDAVAFDQFYYVFEFSMEQSKSDTTVLDFAKTALVALDAKLRIGQFNDDMLREVYPEYPDYRLRRYPESHSIAT